MCSHDITVPDKEFYPICGLFCNHLPCFNPTEPPKAQLDSKLLSETVLVRAGSDLVLDAAVGGRPDPKASWSKGNKELELCEKYHLQYTPSKAMAIIKFCDRDDTGKYILTVRNVSGTKTAEVNVKVLGEYKVFFT